MMPVYVINLDQHCERRRHVAGEMAALGVPYSRIAAVDGHALTDADLEAVVRPPPLAYRWLRTLSKPEVGCYLSHRQAWEKIVNDQQGGGFVFEDDLLVQPHLRTVMEFLSQVDWRSFPVMVQLYCPNRWRYPNPRARLFHYVDLLSSSQLVSRLSNTWGTVAYYVNSAGAEMLLRRVQRIYRPIDDIFRRFWTHGLNVFEVHPPPVQHRDGDSSIEPSREATYRSVRIESTLYHRLILREFQAMSLLYSPVRLHHARRVFSQCVPDVVDIHNNP